MEKSGQTQIFVGLKCIQFGDPLSEKEYEIMNAKLGTGS